MAIASSLFLLLIRPAQRARRLGAAAVGPSASSTRPIRSRGATGSRSRASVWSGTAGYQFFFIGGLARTSVANSSLMLAATPVLIAFMSALLGQERIGRLHWVGATLSMAGIYLVVGHGARSGDSSVTGDLMMFVAVCCWAVYTIGARPLMLRHSPVGVTGRSMAIGTLMYVPLMIPNIVRTQLEQRQRSATWLALIYSAAVRARASPTRSGTCRRSRDRQRPDLGLFEPRPDRRHAHGRGVPGRGHDPGPRSAARPPSCSGWRSRVSAASRSGPAGGGVGRLLQSRQPRERPSLLTACRGAARRAGRGDLARADAASSTRSPPRGTSLVAARQFADPRPGHVGAHPFRAPADLDPARRRPGLHDLQLHRAAARGRAPHGLRAAAGRSPSGSSAFCTPCRAASPPASSRGGTSITTPSSGRTTTIPKRAHLSPKKNARWYKLLYCTPALFPIYFRAARARVGHLSRRPAPPHRLRAQRLDRRRTSRRSALLWYVFGFYAALRTSIIPVFFVFPIAFTLNRLGQHYDIDPDDRGEVGHADAGAAGSGTSRS